MNVFLLLLISAGTFGQEPTDQNIAQYKNLAVYPIYETLGKIHDADYITLDEGLKSGTVTVSEKGGAISIRRPLPYQPSTESPPTPVREDYQGGSGPEVNSLWLINKSGKRLILITGEMVRGGQQDRIIGKDAIIASTGQPVDLGVYCVEHGRWTGEANFAAPAASFGVAAPKMRKAAQYNSSQEGVWSGVAQGGAALHVSSDSDAYRDIAGDKKVSKQVEDYVSALDARFPASRAMGVAIAVNGKLVWVDRFSSNAMFRKYWPKLLRSYAMEALTDQQRLPSRAPSWAAAMNFVNAREGKTSYEVSEFRSKLTKIENKDYVVFRLEDLAVKPAAAVHESKVVKD